MGRLYVFQSDNFNFGKILHFADKLTLRGWEVETL